MGSNAEDECDVPLLKNDQPSKKLLPEYSTDNEYVVAVVYVGRVRKYVKRGTADNARVNMSKDGASGRSFDVERNGWHKGA